MRSSTLSTSSRGDIALVFASSGFLLATWGSRLPAIQEAAHLSGAEIGWLIAALAIGTSVALLAAGRIVARIRPRWSVRIGAVLCVVALLLAASKPIWPMFAAAAILIGIGDALVSVAMNVEGAALGRQRDDARVMPVLHGAWSFGALAGSLGGALAVALQVSLSTHLVTAAALIIMTSLLGSRRFEWTAAAVDVRVQENSAFNDRLNMPGEVRQSSEARRRTLALGLIALGAAFAEGSANDWLTLALADGYHLSHEFAAMGLGLFVAGMLAGRVGSQWIPIRYRPDQLLLAGVVMVVLGTGMVLIGGLVLLPATKMGGVLLAAFGLLAWGLGAALGMPMALGAAAQPPPHSVHDSSSSSARVGMVSTIGYAAFLGGAPLLGWLAAHIGFLWTLAAAPLVMVAAVVAAAVCHPLQLTMRVSAMSHRSTRVREHAHPAEAGANSGRTDEPGVDLGSELLLDRVGGDRSMDRTSSEFG